MWGLMLEHLGGRRVSLLVPPDTLPVRIWTSMHAALGPVLGSASQGRVLSSSRS